MTADSVPGDLVPGVMTEYLTPEWGLFVRSHATLAKFRSALQDVEVHDSAPFGKLFRLDGHFMTSERDEFFYHENLVHIAALAHPAPARALIVGGGDGGSAEELLKHPSLRTVTIAEIDAAVIDRFAFDVELLYLAQSVGLRLKEVPVRWDHNDGSKVNVLRDSLRMFREVQSIRRRSRASLSNIAPSDVRSYKYTEHSTPYSRT